MKIAIATTLFPPDIAEPAAYVKELGRRLSSEHDIRILAYGSIPEEIPEVHIAIIPKRLPSIIRILRFTLALLRETINADYVLVQNAPSTELPLIFVGIFYKHKLLLVMSDKKIAYEGFIKHLHALAITKSNTIIDLEGPAPQPEILPFTNLPNDAVEKYNASWERHIDALQSHFSYA